MIGVLLALAMAEAPTYSRDVAPLLNERCAACHHPNGAAPFALLSYDEVKRHARQIGEVTKNRVMPPWKVDPADGPFVGQRPLTTEEIDLIQKWVEGGALEGDPVEAAPTAAQWTDGWRLGKPDLVVTLERPFTLSAEGTDIFRIFVLPIPVDAERYVRGIEFRPGNPKVVHHANIRVDRTRASRDQDDADPAPGYSGLIMRSAVYPDGHFLGWTPGQVAPLAPSELSWRLAPRTDLVIETHMQPSGRDELVQPSVGFYFGDRPPTRTPAMLRLGRQTIDIPAGQAKYIVTDSYVLPVDIDVIALQPHAHYRLRDARGQATLPDGTVKPLLHIADWDFRWQHVYRFESPLALPKGTKLSMEYTYDNSAGNPRNPEHPPKRARWGQRSADEMGDLWIQALTKNDADLVALDAEFRKKVVAEDVNGYEMEIERHQNDAGLHDSAAMLYLELGRFEPAIAHFQKSLAIKGPSAPAHFNLGTAFALGHQFDEAVYEYQRAIKIDPRYAYAHNNLGNVYLAQGKVDEAIAEFREVVRLQPDSASAKANLDAALRRKPQPR